MCDVYYHNISKADNLKTKRDRKKFDDLLAFSIKNMHFNKKKKSKKILHLEYKINLY